MRRASAQVAGFRPFQVVHITSMLFRAPPPSTEIVSVPAKFEPTLFGNIIFPSMRLYFLSKLDLWPVSASSLLLELTQPQLRPITWWDC